MRREFHPRRVENTEKKFAGNTHQEFAHGYGNEIFQADKPGSADEEGRSNVTNRESLSFISDSTN